MERWWEPPPEPQDASIGAHLFVCQHGLWGSPEDVSFLEQYLRHNGWLTLNARSNSARCTFDGADVCGDRLAAEVVSHVQQLAKGGVTVTHISFAAYSFGGLIARYAVGKLRASGFFSVVVPVNFLTIATPHLGCWEHPSSMSHLAYNSILPWTLSRTGRQLLLADRWLEPEGLPLLAAMARPDLAFHAALASFSKRVLLADIRSDRTVPYTTAAITAVNPYLPPGAAAPYGMPSSSRGQGCSCGCACGCGCCSARREQQAFSLTEQDDEGEGADDGPGALDELGLGDGDGDGDGGGVGAGAGRLIRACSVLMGVGPVLSFGLGIASLLFGGRGAGVGWGGSSNINSAARAGNGDASNRRRRDSTVGCGCGCSSCSCSSAGGAAGGGDGSDSLPAAPMIALPISASYPCIVTPHLSPLLQPAGATSKCTAPGRLRSCGSRGLPVAASSSAKLPALHRSASSPLPKLLDATSIAVGGRGSSNHGTVCGGPSTRLGWSAPHAPIPAARARADATPSAAAAATGWVPPPRTTLHRHRSAAAVQTAPGGGSFSPGRDGAFAALRRANAASGTPGYGYAVPPGSPQSPLRHGCASTSALPRVSDIRARHGPGPFAPRTAATSARGHSSSSGGEGSRGSGSGGQDVLASRVRLGLFISLLPVLLSLWLCMVAWLAAIWIHHYAVLLTVRPDRSWDVRLRPPSAAADFGDGEHGGGGDGEAEGDGEDGGERRAAAAAKAVQEGDGSVPYDGGELDTSVELLVRLTEAAPPLPSALRQRQRPQYRLGPQCGRGTPAGPEPEEAAKASAPGQSLDIRSEAAPPRASSPDYPGHSYRQRTPPKGPVPAAAAVAASVNNAAVPDSHASATSGLEASQAAVDVGALLASRRTDPDSCSPRRQDAAAASAPSEVLVGRAVSGQAHADAALGTPLQEPDGEGSGQQRDRPAAKTAEVTGSLPPRSPSLTKDVDVGVQAEVAPPAMAPGVNVTLQRNDMGCPVAGAELAAPISVTAAEVAEAEAEAAVAALVRSIFTSLVRQYDRDPCPASPVLEPAIAPTGTDPMTARHQLAAAAAGSQGQVVTGTECHAQPRPEAEADLAAQFGADAGTVRDYIRGLTQSMFRSVVQRHDCHARGGGDVRADSSDTTAERSACGGPRVPTDGLPDPPSTALDGQLDGAELPRCSREPPPLPAAEASLGSGPTHVEAGGDGGRLAASAKLRGCQRTHDPAELLAEMIADLNQLDWQKVDVDTRHYHAHAAIVVRSSRRFRSHMHIIDYAVRQLQL